MFSEVETNYILSLINTYQCNGYHYYLCHTITENNNNYDICIYFSEKEIQAISSNMFDLTNAICIKIDSSSRNDNSYNPSTHSREYVENSNLTDVIEVNRAEFVYTNAVFNTSASTFVNPDLLLNASTSYSSYLLSSATIFLLGSIFLYMFFKSILRIKK